MNENPAPLILCVDDDPDILKLLERYLKPAGYRLHFESDPVKGLTAAKGQKPALILVDLMMPQMSGYQFCERLQEDEDTAYIPVIFVTASTKQEDRQKALSSGAADYLEKPIKKEVLLSKIEACLNAGEKWSSLPFSTQNWAETISPAQYLGFREWLSQKFNITEDKKDFLDSLSSADIYLSSQAGALTASEIAKSMAEYLKLDYLPQINPEKIKLGVLPSAFSRRNEVVAISGQYNQLVFLVSNPFNLELLSLLENYDRGGKGVKAFDNRARQNKAVVRKPGPERRRVLGRNRLQPGDH